VAGKTTRIGIFREIEWVVRRIEQRFGFRRPVAVRVTVQALGNSQLISNAPP